MLSRKVVRRMRLRTAHCRNWLGILPFILASPALAQTGFAGAGKPCQQSVRHAAHSCQDEAKSDYFLALGKCDNLANGAARAACRDQAAADRQDALATCAEAEDARDDVCDRLGGGPYDPVIDPSNFVSQISTILISRSCPARRSSTRAPRRTGSSTTSSSSRTTPARFSA